ncbi:hypothetical protein NAF17_13265 [Mucilaginibacter sp. RB4R14]|uniref:hypothetical protein n=1 Tax=Mucilaginibacter aurantiaciroseus TaxID=2949308 RepID=UPI00209080ED|nr:hypothetical protein [Mucilaginibacter aurantiaciroseus]MCO5936510.1 hypothetical protein [Mucilaginibacter aurantiaciroseus]
MSKQKKYQLISGIFNSSEAKAIIVSFYNHKINYHNNQLLRAIECNEGNVSHIEQKIMDLNHTSESIKKFLADGIEPDQLVEVKGFIEINLDPLGNG